MRRAHAVLLSFLALVPATAFADVLVQLGNGDRVTGTFSPATETETYLVDLPEGATLSVRVAGKRKRGAGPVPTLAISDPEGTPFPASAVTTTATGARVGGLRIAASGRYRIALGSATEGDYTLVVAWKNPTGGTQTVDFGKDTDVVVPVHAAPGSAATFRISALDDPDGAPRFVLLRATDDSSATDLLRVPAPSGPSDATPRIVLGAAADYELTVRQTGGAGGLAKLTTRLVPPKAKPRRVDLSSRTLGSGTTGSFAQGAVLGTSGGTVFAGLFEEDPLVGASVEVPPGALRGSSLVFVGTARDVDPRGDVEPQGPAVEFGPSGLRFAEGSPARVTIPFDVDAFGGDFSQLVVLVRNGSRVEVVPPESVEVDVSRGTVSFPAAHFSTYQVFGPRRAGRADLNGDGFDDLALPSAYAGNFSGNVRVVLGGPGLVSGPVSDAEVSIFGNAPNEGAFGYLTALGDVDGDGTTDLAVASYGFDTSYFGVARVFLGGTTFSPDESVDAEVEVRTAAGDGGALGALGVADVTGDGVADLVVGAPDASATATDEGHVFVVPGGAGIASTRTDGTAVIRLAGGVPDRNLGQALAFADFDGDGFTDVAVGAPRRFGGSGDLGAVVVVRGGPQLASGTISAYSVLTGTAPDARFGAALAAADFDGDGRVDLAVGAPRTTPQDPAVPLGAVHVFRGPLPASGTAADAAETIFCEPAQGQPLTLGGAEFGVTLLAAHVVGDPLRDLIIGCPLTTPAADPSLADAGVVVIVRGDSKFGATRTFEFGTEVSATRGAAILPCVDTDGDRVLETVIAETGAANDAGRVTVRFGPNRLGREVTVTGLAGNRLGGRDFNN